MVEQYKNMTLMTSMEDDDIRECPVCLNKIVDCYFFTTNPDKDGVCEHNFCKECAQNVINKAKPSGTPTCPSCRRVIICAAPNKFADNLLKEMEKVKKQLTKNAIGQKEIDKVQVMYQKEMEKLRERMETDRKKIQELEIDKMKNVEATKTLSDILSNYKKQQEVNERMADELEKMQKHRKELEAERFRLNHRVENILAEMESEKRELGEKEKQIAELTNELKKMVVTKRETEEIRARAQQYETKLAAMTEEMEKMRLNYHTLQNSYEVLQKNYEGVISMPKDNASSWFGTSWSTVPAWSSPNWSQLKESTKSIAMTSAKIIGSAVPQQKRNGELIVPTTDFEFQERRGMKREGTVWKILFKPKKTLKALKAISPQFIEGAPDINGFISKSILRSTFGEAYMLHKLEHKNIPKLEGVVRDCFSPENERNLQSFFMMPFMEFDLDFLIVANHSKSVIFDVGKMGNLRWNETLIKEITFQVLKAVYYLHSADIVHRNIKPASILVDESGNVMLASFSKAVALRCSKPLLIPLANRFSPPEYCHSSETKSSSPAFWKASDMWSVGLLIGCMIKGSYIFESTKKNDLLAEIVNTKETAPTPQDIKKYPAVESYLNLKAPRSFVQSFIDRNRNYALATDLMKKILFFEPTSRLTAVDALQHPWFKDLPQYSDVHRTCPLGDEFEDEKLDEFISKCGGF